MSSPIGLNITVNNNMDHCCPRKVKVSLCCCKVDDDVDEKVQEVAKGAIESSSDDEDEKC